MKYENQIMFAFIAVIVSLFAIIIIQSYELEDADLMMKKINSQRIELENQVMHLEGQNNYKEETINKQTNKINNLNNELEQTQNSLIKYKDEYIFMRKSFMNEYNMQTFPEMIDGLYNNKSIHVQVTEDIEKNLKSLCHETIHYIKDQDPEYFTKHFINQNYEGE